MEHFNVLPVSTWKHLGVNGSGEAMGLPSLAGGEKKAWQMEVPEGVVRSGSIPQACRDLETGIGPVFDRHVEQNADVCFFGCVEAGITVQNPVVLDQDAGGSRQRVRHFALHAEAGSRVTWLQICHGSQAEEARVMDLTQIRADTNAHVSLIQVQTLKKTGRRWNGVALSLGEGAHVDVIRLELGGVSAVCGCRAMLEGAQGVYSLDAIYFGGGTQDFDINDHTIHLGERTSSRMDTAGVLAGASQKILRQTLDFRRGASAAVGKERESVLLLSDKVRSRTVPLILCGEENVEGSHAVSMGTVDETQLLYLVSRGIPLGQARRMLAQARFAPTLEKIPQPDLRSGILKFIQRRFDAHAGFFG